MFSSSVSSIQMCCSGLYYPNKLEVQKVSCVIKIHIQV